MNEITQELIKSEQLAASLKPKEVKFALAYLETGNLTKSALAAGYSEKSARNQGQRLMQREAILSYIEALKCELAEEHKAIFSTIIRRTDELTRLAERGNLKLTPKGEPVKVKGKLVYVLDTANALKGLDQLSRLGRLYEKDGGKLKPAAEVWTGIEINFGEGSVNILSKTKVESNETPKSETKESPPKNEAS